MRSPRRSRPHLQRPLVALLLSPHSKPHRQHARTGSQPARREQQRGPVAADAASLLPIRHRQRLPDAPAAAAVDGREGGRSPGERSRGGGRLLPQRLHAIRLPVVRRLGRARADRVQSLHQGESVVFLRRSVRTWCCTWLAARRSSSSSPCRESWSR